MKGIKHCWESTAAFHSFHGLMNSINWPASSVWVFIAQLGEHCSANAEATGSNPVEAPKNVFKGYFRNYLNCDSLRWSHTHFICIPAVHIILFRVLILFYSLIVWIVEQFRVVVNLNLAQRFQLREPRLVEIQDWSLI